MVGEDRVVKFLREISNRLWEISKKLDELSRDIDNFIDAYDDAYSEYSGEDWEEFTVDYDYNYLCQDCGHEFEEFTRTCPKCGSKDVIQIAK